VTTSGAAAPWRLADGRERVALYPRPPALEASSQLVRIEAAGRLIAESRRSLRVLETFHPPTLYLPPETIDPALLEPVPGRSVCEWKGVARYFDLVVPGPDGVPQRRSAALWSYPEPTPAFRELAGWLGVYPGRMDGCWLDGEPVRPQPGGFYAGWITEALVGPFKGDPLHPELI